MISHILLTPPVCEPVSVDEIKMHARIEHGEDDVLLSALITAARQWCEHYTRRAFISQVWDLSLTGVPNKRSITLPRAPLLSISMVQTFDNNDNLLLMSSDAYYADILSSPGQIVLHNGSSWPLSSRSTNGIVITYKAGYGESADAVPSPIKLAIKQLTLHWYDYRGDSVHTTMTNRAPLTIEASLDPYRVINLGGN